MAVSKSTIIKALGTTKAVVVKWSSAASNANNVYFDVNNVDASRAIILVACKKSTAFWTTSTGGYLYIGASASASSGSCWERTYSYRGGPKSRVRVKFEGPDTAAKEALRTTAGSTPLAIAVLGPFETARFKDSNGYIKVSKAKDALSNGDSQVKLSMILLP